MLRYMRNNADSPVMLFLLGLIGLVFVLFFGSGALTAQRSESVAEVNGEVLREQEVNFRWRSAVRQQQRPGSSLSDADQQRIRRQVIDAMIEESLMLQAADDMGIVISDKELRRAVLQEPYFQDDEGNFSRTKYEAYLSRSPSVARAERNLQRDLRRSRTLALVSDLVTASAQVSETELKEAWRKENSKRSVQFVRVPNALFRDEAALTGDAAEAWAKENEDAIRERFDRDFERKYSTAEQRRARHILLKFGKDDDETKRTETRAKMEGILALARAEGADFAALATEHSEDGSAARGGDLDFFDRTRMVKPFSEAAFSQEIGIVGDIVETQYGLHIIKVEETKAATTKAFDDVRLVIAGELAAEDRAPELARAYAATLVGALDGTLEAEAAAALIEERKLTLQDSGDFALDARTIPKLGASDAAVQAAFAMTTAGSVTEEPVEVPNGWAVMKLVSATDPDEANYADEKERIRGRLQISKQVRALGAWKKQLKESAKISIAAGA